MAEKTKVLIELDLSKETTVTFKPVAAEMVKTAPLDAGVKEEASWSSHPTASGIDGGIDVDWGWDF